MINMKNKVQNVRLPNMPFFGCTRDYSLNELGKKDLCNNCPDVVCTRPFTAIEFIRKNGLQKWEESGRIF